MIRFIVSKLVLIGGFIAAVDAHAQLLYETNADGVSVTITGYTNSVPDVLIIPATINGLTVTAIGDSALSEVGNLVSVTIPINVTTIGEDAFSGTDLTNLVIPYGVTNIGEAAFESCELLTNVVFPESLRSIGDDAFGSCRSLTSITIPASVTDLGSAFDGCYDLTNFVIESEITSLGGAMFTGCDLLHTITIPATVTNIGDYAFSQCTGLIEIFFEGNAPLVNNTAFENLAGNPFGADTSYYSATAYYLPGTTGWDQFMSNTIITPSENPNVTTNIFIPEVLWNPTIQATGTNFGVQNGQYGFDITTTSTKLPIAIEACDDASQGNWVVLQRLTLTNGLYHFSEPFQSNAPSRFYRIGFP